MRKKVSKDSSIIKVIEDRINDPNYIPTGPTYGEVAPANSPEEESTIVAKVNWYREARITPEARDCLNPKYQEIRRKTGASIAAEIRRGITPHGGAL